MDLNYSSSCNLAQVYKPDSERVQLGQQSFRAKIVVEHHPTSSTSPILLQLMHKACQLWQERTLY